LLKAKQRYLHTCGFLCQLGPEGRLVEVAKYMGTAAGISRAFAAASLCGWRTVLLPLPICVVCICSSAAAWGQTFPLKPVSIFSDGAGLPEMVVVPPGTLAIGAPTADEMRWHQHSTPPNPSPHEISFPQPFAIAEYPIMIGQWDACVAAGGCGGYMPQLPAYLHAGPDDAVTRISYFDAQSYVVWLNEVTSKADKGKPYALPSEAQWEMPPPPARNGLTLPPIRHGWPNFLRQILTPTIVTGPTSCFPG
jgi:hypothetical protein